MAQAPADVEIRIEPLRGNIYVLYGEGGNIGVSAGSEGVFLIDDQFAPLTPGILARIREISDAPVRFVLNTHYHGDHTGGNENLGREGAVIVAHDNVRLQLIETPREGAALPVLTFNDQVSIHLNGEEARAVHIKAAHTAGDSIVWFQDSNIVHMGDVFFHELYPFIDIDAGGDIDGLIMAVSQVLDKIDDETIIIPGHGLVTDKAGLAAHLEFLRTIRAAVQALKQQGKTLDEVVAANLTEPNDEAMTWEVTGEYFITTVYKSAD